MKEQDIIENDPELNGKYLGTITRDFVKVSDNLKEASSLIRNQGFSENPIFPVSKVDIPIGKLLYGKDELGLEWNYFASFMEEFIERKIIDVNKKDAFIQSYKDADEFCCLFVVDKDFTNFVYVPYPED